jgi:ABC-type Co2+ transport system permease subunit
MNNLFDLNEFVKRAIKYLVEGIMVAIVAYSIPKKSLNIEEVVIIGLMAAATFAILDIFSPSIGASARNGAGMVVGAGLGGGLPIR